MNNLEDFKYIKGFGGGGGSQAAQPTAAYEDVEGFIYNGTPYNVYQFAKVKDLISEGPIEGLLDGQYNFSGQVGDLGFRRVTYNEYPASIGETSQVRYLKSIQWNQTPLLDSQDRYNFQQINVNVTNGTPIGTSVGGEFDNVSYIRSIGERLRGPNQLAVTEDEVSDYQRSYRIINRECKKLSLNFRISSLYVTLKYQDLQPVIDKTLQIEGVNSANVAGNYFTLDPANRKIDDQQDKQTEIKGGVGSVIYYKFKLRIKVSAIYKEGYNSNSATLDIVSATPKNIIDDKDLSIVLDTSPQILEIECKGKVTQGYSKQIVLDMSSIFASLNTDDNWLGWDISVLKVTPEDTFSSRGSFVSLESITEIYSSSFRYTNSAIVTSKFNAAYFSRIPERAYDVKLLKVKVPSNYDPITKTYGNITPITINATNTFTKTDKLITTDFFLGENNSYINTDNNNPPITDGLIAQFDANVATASGGTVNGWNNTVAGSTIKCILGDGTYASPVGTNYKPSKGVGVSEQSPNGTYGVSFTTTQWARFVYQAETNPLAGSNGDFTVFVVAKWDSSATASERNRIVSSYSLENTFVLGFENKFNSTFTVGNRVYGILPGGGAGFTNFNRSNYWNTSNDTNTYIVGVSATNLKDINIFWQNTNYFVKPTDATPPPRGLAINWGGASTKSKCTVFEILVYNKALSKSEGIKVRNWLNKKWNLVANSLSYASSIANSYNTNVLNVGASTYLTMPFKTLCANGQRTKAYAYAGGDLGVDQYYEFDLVPQRYWRNWTLQQKFSLKDQGFCSFYCDFYLKLSASLTNGTYSLAHRDGQFNLSIKIDNDNTSLILTIISSNENKNYTINKALDPLKYSTTILKSKFTRISLYVLPKVVKPSFSFVPNASLATNINANDYSWNKDNPLVIIKSSVSPEETEIMTKMGLTKNSWSSLINAINFREDTSYSSELSILPDNCRYYHACYFSDMIQVFKNGPLQQALYVRRILAQDYFPDILNAEIDVLVDLEKQIQCNINIAKYSSYQTLCVKSNFRPSADATYPDVLAKRSEVEKISEAALKTYNESNANKVFDGSSTSVSLLSTETTVLLPLAGGQIYDPVALKTGPFIPAYFITNNNKIEIFTDKSSAGFGGKFLGYADSVRVNQIDFDRISLYKAFSRTLFSEGLPKKTTVYEPNVIQSYTQSNDYWDGTFKAQKEWTDNPAWCFYDLLTNKRYGAGNFITENDVDKWSLYQIAKYCDELVSDGFGGVEPRFTCNVYIQTQEDALKVMGDMASVFRGMFYYSNGFIYAINDMPENTPVYAFTNSNVVDGNFNYESTSLKDRNSAVYIRYIDKNNFYKPAVEYVENIEAIRKFGFKETELTAFGCTSRGQAQRLGRWLLASEYNETETISFEAGPECVYLKPGDVIKVYDYNRKYKTVGGRLNLINISGDSNATTGILTLDRKLDFDFSGNKNYRFSILSPKYNLDPSVKNAVNSSVDYDEYRKPLTNSFIVNSGNLITGQSYDSIRITGLASVMASGLNVTGLGYFTGASGMSPKSITWVMENSGNLNGSVDSDYDFYRVFRIQESTEGTNYTVLGSQMYHLKYTQIESGLNITPAKLPAAEASSPSRALFTVDSNAIKIDIFYDSSIRNNTIGFKVFSKAFYGSDFDPNKSSDFKFVPINLYDSYINTSIDKPLAQGSIRIYGMNIDNNSPLSYIEAKDSQNTNETFFPADIGISYKDVNTNSFISLNNNTYYFQSPVSITRSSYFLSTNPNNVQNVKPQNALSFNIPLQFITNPSKFPNINYPYRIVMVPEKVDNKDSFTPILRKYYNSSNIYDYVVNDGKSSIDDIYSYTTFISRGKYRSFSLAIDKMIITDRGVQSTSNDFSNSNGFLLVTYDNQDQALISSLNGILKDTRNSFSIVTTAGSSKLNITINQDLADSFVNKFYLLLIPTDKTFQFGTNTINHDNGSPISINDNSGIEIKDSHFISIPNTQKVFNFNSNTDDNGKSFSLTSYKAYLIASDSLMSAWVSYAEAGSTRNILDYSSNFIDKDNNIGKIYPLISDSITVQKVEDVTTPLSLEKVLKDAGSRYLHFTLNKITMIENIFDTSLVATSIFPNYTISRRSVIYKPSIDTNLTSQDNRILSTDPNGTMAYYKLSLQNRDNISNAPIAPTIPQSKRAYSLNGNKIFTRALTENTDTAASPKLIQGVNSEGDNPNIYKLKSTITDSSFGKDGQELFDISIIRLSDLSGELKSKITDYSSYNSISINSSTSSTQATSETVFNSLINNGLFNSSFNIINITPEGNWSELGLSNPKNITCTLGNVPKPLTVYTLNGDIISNQFSLPSINSLYYAGVPVLEEDSLSLSLTIKDIIKETRAIKVYCFNGEDIIPFDLNQTTINKGEYNNIRVFLGGLKFKNYYTYANSYNAGTSITNSNFWKFESPKNLAFAHLSAKNALGSIPKYNFHIQALELSIVVTY